MDPPTTINPLQQVLAYHEQTKHHPHRYARSAGFLDWATQPDPFRRFHGADLILLDEIALSEKPSYDSIFADSDVVPLPVNRQSVSQLLYDSLALSTWKQHLESRWALRINPSSGNLHPTEGYLIAPPIAEVCDDAGIFHYCPYEHGLETRYRLTGDQWQKLAADLPSQALLVGLTSIYWRESWKYGERAFRYCQHDVGHAIAAIAIAAAVLGWNAQLLDAVTDEDLAVLCGLHKQNGIEAEHPEALILLYPKDHVSTPAAPHHYRLPQPLLRELRQTDPQGRPNTLSPDHRPWPIIDEVSQATLHRESTTSHCAAPPPIMETHDPDRGLGARRLIHQRRSAVALDGDTGITAPAFYRLLKRLLPIRNPLPFSSLAWQPRVHLALFVHRVEGLAPGLYFLLRDHHQLADLQAALQSEFSWRRPDNCPEEVPLYLLVEADTRHAAMIVSCGQDIAADGAFSLGMIAQYQQPLREFGPWFYKRLFWECGVIGQLLYLEAEAAQLRGTGIGCFLDDSMHDILGIATGAYQSLYHFTLGGPVEDPRIQSAPAYAHRQQKT